MQASHSNKRLKGKKLLKALKDGLPQLQLPQVHGISKTTLYAASVLRNEQLNDLALEKVGSPPEWHQPEALQFWIAPHPCGAMPVVMTSCWHDFTQLVRALAHRAEPVTLKDGVHAQAVNGLIHWGLIKQFGRESRAQLILLHEAPYGSVGAQHVPGDLDDQTWIECSTRLRLEHELTHLATKRVLGEMRINLLDELIADCMGMVASLGWFASTLFGRCMGISEHKQLGEDNRWATYTRGLSPTDAETATTLVMMRSIELENELKANSQLCMPDMAMERLRWLCRQRLDQPISAP